VVSEAGGPISVEQALSFKAPPESHTRWAGAVLPIGFGKNGFRSAIIFFDHPGGRGFSLFVWD
jgi:hypothetical protein